MGSWASIARGEVADFPQKIADTVRESLLVLNADLRVLFANTSFLRSFKVEPGVTEGRLVHELGNNQWDIPELRQLLEEILPNNEAFDDYRVEHRFEGIGRRVMLLNGRRLDQEQLILLAIEDVTDRDEAEIRLRESERHSNLLLAELQHRVRNTAAVVRSVARRTAERSTNLDEMISHFEGRLNAFARIQSAVTRSPGGVVDLQTIFEDELLALATREGNQLHISGPKVGLKSKTAETISLAIHELATNALKYGALLDHHGRISVEWDRARANGKDDLLDLKWVETGLREPPNPTREGFGHELLLRTLPYDLRAETRIDFTDQGMRFTMRMPLRPDVLAGDIS